MSESYSEKVLAYSENRAEPYQEREIRAKSHEKLVTIEEKEESEKSPIPQSQQQPKQCSSRLEGEMVEIVPSSSSSSSSSSSGSGRMTDSAYDRSSSLSSFSMSSYETPTPISLNYSKIVNDINLDGLNLTLSFAGDDTSNISTLLSIMRKLLNKLCNTKISYICQIFRFCMLQKVNHFLIF